MGVGGVDGGEACGSGKVQRANWEEYWRNQVWSREVSESRSKPVNLWEVTPESVEFSSPKGK